MLWPFFAKFGSINVQRSVIVRESNHLFEYLMRSRKSINRVKGKNNVSPVCSSYPARPIIFVPYDSAFMRNVCTTNTYNSASIYITIEDDIQMIVVEVKVIQSYCHGCQWLVQTCILTGTGMVFQSQAQHCASLQ